MRELGYRPALDGLRAVAITAVVVVHAVGFPANGGLGVDLFFVLSGFLITTLLLEERTRTGAVSLAGFYRRRCLRLLPALAAFLGVYLLVSLSFFTTSRETVWVHLGGVLAGIFYVMNILKASGFDTPDGIEHLWSLSAEEQFYVIWPAALLLAVGIFQRRLWPIAVALIVCLVAVQVREIHLLVSRATEARVSFGADARAGSLIIGCLLGILLFTRPDVKLDRRVLGLAVVVFGLVLFADLGLTLFAGPLLVFGLACACLIVAALDEGTRLARALSIGAVVYLGKLSYSLYIWHVPILVWLGAGGGGFELIDLLAVALALAAAIASYHLVERPFLRLKRSPKHAPRARPSTETASALA